MSALNEEVLYLSSDSETSSPVDRLGGSFCSVTTSVGPDNRFCFSTRPKAVNREVTTFVETSEEEEESQWGSDVEDEEVQQDQINDERARRLRLINGPSRANLASDRHKIEAAKQNALNEFILHHSKLCVLSRQDHHIMLRQLIGTAYFYDKDHVENRPHWKKFIAAIRKEYWGATAIFNLSPDPYHNVLAKLSSMMLWNDDARSWQYQYCEGELDRRRATQMATLEKLQREGKLFL